MKKPFRAWVTLEFFGNSITVSMEWYESEALKSDFTGFDAIYCVLAYQEY